MITNGVIPSTLVKACLTSSQANLHLSAMLKRTLLSIAATLVIFQEWLWDILTLAGTWLPKRLHLERFEERLVSATRYQALFILFVPALLLVPINVFEFILLINGAMIPSIALEIISKRFCAMFAARVFN